MSDIGEHPKVEALQAKLEDERRYAEAVSRGTDRLVAGAEERIRQVERQARNIAEERDRYRAIVEDLAAGPPPCSEEELEVRCAFCDVFVNDYVHDTMPPAHEHSDNCLWRRAVEAAR